MKSIRLLGLMLLITSMSRAEDPTISTKTNLLVGEKFMVTWSGTNIITGDWIALVEASAPIVIRNALEAADAQSVSRQATFTAPSEGNYEVRYVRQQAPNTELYTTIGAQAVTVRQHNPTNFAITLSQTEALPRQGVTVKWYPDAGNTTYNDSIIMVEVGKTNLPQDALQATAARRWFNNNQETYYITEPGTYRFIYARESPPRSNTYDILAMSELLSIRSVITNATLVRNFPALGRSTVVAFGDSLTAGIGATDDGAGFVPELALRLGCATSGVINAGKSGDTTRDALNRLESDVLTYNPKIVVVMLGGNNIFRRINDNTTYTELRTIVDRIHDNGAIVVLIGVQGGGYVSNLAPICERISNETGCVYVPNILHGIIGTTRLMSDLVHPDNGGYGIMARRVAPVIQELLGVRTTPTLYVKHSEQDSSARITIGLVPSLNYTLYTSPDFSTWRPFVTFDGNNTVTVETGGATNAAFFYIGPRAPDDPIGTTTASELETIENAPSP